VLSAADTLALRAALSVAAAPAAGAVVSTATARIARSGAALTSPWPLTEIVRRRSLGASSAITERDVANVALDPRAASSKTTILGMTISFRWSPVGDAVMYGASPLRNRDRTTRASAGSARTSDRLRHAGSGKIANRARRKRGDNADTRCTDQRAAHPRS